MTPLHRLAGKAGLLIDWRDAAGKPKRVADDSLIAILDALGLPAASDRAIRDSLARLASEQRENAATFLTADVGRPIAAPRLLRGKARAQLHLESGDRRDFDPADGIPPIEEPGYHRMEADGALLHLAVAPHHGFTVREAAAGRRIWAAAVQIPSLRDRREEAFGDFGALAHFVEAAAARGADAVAISPIHALFPADPSRHGPYAPSSRLFLNVLLADPSLLGDTGPGGGQGDLIDWSSAIPQRMERLRRLYDKRGEESRVAVEAFRKAGGPELELHARFDALHAHFLRREGSRGWQDWPDRYHDPQGEAVAAFARVHGEEISFHIFLQWLADRGLAAAQVRARSSGMAIGLIADMAIGVDAGGSQAWGRPGTLLTGLSLGAPPDLLGPEGQDWGITTFSPGALRHTGFHDFISTIRAALREAGGVRIDHAMGLRRLWVVPHGASPRDGAYLSYPETDMMRLLALESRRAHAIVVGEDLGTVPTGFRPEMDRFGFLGMRVLWFERTRGGGFRAPEAWSGHAAAMTSTHDLPTIAGWWHGRDIDWNHDLERIADSSEAQDRQTRTRDRTRLWRACRKAGVASGPEPPPDRPEQAVTAAIAYVGAAASDIAIIPAEDLLGLSEQPNLPGTLDEHPNWRRRLPGHVDDMLDRPDVASRVDALDTARRR